MEIFYTFGTTSANIAGHRPGSTYLIRTTFRAAPGCYSFASADFTSEALERETRLHNSVRVLLVDDFAPWRQAVFSMLAKKTECEVVGEASDGLEAVEKAVALKPDVILRDIGLPTLNGIEAARQIRKHVPQSKIIFLSQESSPDIMQEAVSVGASGYVVKTMAGSHLLATLDSVLRASREQCQFGPLDSKPSKAAVQAD
jgi:PleD family two-component response regulator